MSYVRNTLIIVRVSSITVINITKEEIKYDYFGSFNDVSLFAPGWL